MIRILHSELENITGGIETFLMNLTKCIDLNEFQFDFLLRGENKYLEETLENQGCNIYKVPKGIINYIRFIFNLLQTEKYDVAHIHKNSAANILLPICIKIFAKIPIIIHSHNTRPSKSNIVKILLHYINRALLRMIADGHLACSELAAKWLFGKKYVMSKKVKIIKNGIIVDEYKFDPQNRRKIRKALGIEGKYVIGHIGAFRKQKNHKYLMQIMKEINDHSVALVLVGRGVLLEDIKKMAKDMGVSDNVFFLGQRTDVKDLLMAMDIVLLPSLYEGFPMVSIEAQASGLPLILSDYISESCNITGNVQFLSIKEEDIELWVQKVQKLRSTYMRENTYERIIDSGYDMMFTADYLSNQYRC